MKKLLKTTLLATLIGTSFLGANAMAADYK
ncbi:Uncharacterised protein [Aggregatibacter actinomycetemcomitans]|nr:Uncharacterised protein [Aggregatibacter actinomycetemcomitans]